MKGTGGGAIRKVLEEWGLRTHTETERENELPVNLIVLSSE